MKNNKILVIAIAAVLMLSLIPAITLTAATDDEFGTQRDYVTAMIKSAGMLDSAMGTSNNDKDLLAKSLGFLDNWDYNPTADVTAEIAAQMDAAMADAYNGLRTALAKVPMEPYFVNGMAQPIFPYGNSSYYDTSGEGVVRFLVYVETGYDTDADGKLDLIKVVVQLPRAAVEKGMKCATIYHAQPYNEGTNGSSVSYPAGVQPEGIAYLAANGPFEHEKLHLIVPPRVPAGIATTQEMAANARWQDWRYSYTYNASTLDATVVWGVANGNQVGSLNLHDYFVVRGYALVSTAGLSTVAGEGLATYGADIEIDAYKCVIDWLNGRAKAYTDKTSNIEIKADWSNGLVGMTGTSYGGSTPCGIATSGVEGLETIIPVCGVTSYYDYQNQQGAINGSAGYTPGMVWYPLSRIGSPDWAPGSPIRARQIGYMQQMLNEATVLTGNYGEHWARRDYTLDGWYKDWGPSKMKTPMLIVHGTNDNNVRPKQSVLMYQMAQKAGVEARFIWDQGAHMTPTNHQMGDYIYQEWQNLWYSHFLYKVDNNVLDMMPEFFAQDNLTGDYVGYDSFDTANKLVLDNKNRVVATPGTPYDFSDLRYEEPVENEDDFYLLGGLPPADSQKNAAADKAGSDEGLPFVVSDTAADDKYTLINSVNGSASWQNFLDLPTAASTLYSLVLPEDVTVRGVVAINFRAALETLGSALFTSNSQIRVHAKLVEIAAPGATLRYYGGNAVGDSPATSTVLSGGVYRGGGLSSSNLVRFTPTTTGTYREIARGWMNLAQPNSGYTPSSSHIDNRINLNESIGVFHDYTLYLQPCAHTAKAGNRLALILTTGGTNSAAYSGTSAFSFNVDNEATNVVIPVEFPLSDNSVTIEVADAWGKPGGTVDVTYKISGNDLGFSTLDLSVPYDHNIYTPIAVKPAGDLNSPFFVANPNYQTDLMKIAFAAQENVSGDGLLFTVTYQIAATIPLTGSCPLDVKVVKIQFGTFSDAMLDLEATVIPGTLVLGILGDINGDGAITPEDAMVLLQMYVGLIPWTPRALLLGDVNGDGVIDTTDAALILRMVVGG
ncbi:MAG: dockerin type I domain-containing protein [Clostridiales bacterium]|nr:dockerin type I domain-containing protein [Clostridiales bacterium]MDR2712886.1 dockerin type I domain-containing protein [Clostridiales bacterium]